MDWQSVNEALWWAAAWVLHWLPLFVVVAAAFAGGAWWHRCQDRAIRLKELEVTRLEREIDLERARHWGGGLGPPPVI